MKINTECAPHVIKIYINLIFILKKAVIPA